MQRTEISFHSGSILTKEMLKDMYEYPRVVMESCYSAYSDGILYGLEWKENSKIPGHHVITPGALKLHGKIYFMQQPLCVEESFEDVVIDKRYRLFFIEREEFEKEPSREIFKLDFVAVLSAEADEVRQKGYYYSYIEVASGNKFETIIDSENMYGLYAAKDGYSFSLPPYMLNERVLPILEKKSEKHPLDYELFRMICSCESMPLQMVVIYIKEYCKTISKDEAYLSEIVDNSVKIFEEFIEAVENLHGEKVIVSDEKKKEIHEKENEITIKYQGTL